MAYSIKMYKAVAGANAHLLGVQLGAVCIDAQIPVQIVSGWLGLTRQGVYYWFTGTTTVATRHTEKVERIIKVLTSALDAGDLPAEDIKSALNVVKRYKENIK